MKTINLLPKARQSEVRLEDRYHIIMIFFGISMITLVLTLVSIGATHVYLASQSSNIDSEIENLRASVNKQENSEIKAKIGVINNQIKDFRDLTETTPNWSKVLLAFGRLVPQGVSIKNLNADLEKRRIDINGLADKRELVDELYNNIKGDTDNFMDINYPLENVAKPTDVSFRFTFTVKPEALKP